MSEQFIKRAAKDIAKAKKVVALTGAGLEGAEFFFAEGPPCRHPYQDLSALLHSPPAGEKIRGYPWPGDRHLGVGPRH